VARLIERACATKVKATQLTLSLCYQIRLTLEMFAEHRYRLGGIPSLNTYTERIAPA
jgi:hypothetical protein